jgi:hypothetical protein
VTASLIMRGYLVFHGFLVRRLLLAGFSTDGKTEINANPCEIWDIFWQRFGSEGRSLLTIQPCRMTAAPLLEPVYPRRESNPHLRFRKPPFYPLNYGDKRNDRQ